MKRPGPVTGKPLVRPAYERFWEKVMFRPGSCWEWTGKLAGAGYGMFYPAPKPGVYAHRYAYESEFGPIPDGLHIDHLCRTASCVNPLHLEAVTRKENSQRGVHRCSKKTTCSNGHPFDRLWRCKGGKKTRSCSICNNESHRRRRHLGRTS